MNQAGRWVKYYDLVLTMRHTKAEVVSLEELIAKVQSRFNKKDDFIKVFDDETHSIRISDISVDKAKGLAHFLLVSSDSKKQDVVYSKIKSGKSREINKEEGEGLAKSAHFTVSLNPMDDDCYLAMLESVMHMSKNTVEPFLKHVFKSVTDGECEFENEKKEKIPTYAIVHLNPHMSKEAYENLKTGDIYGIRLIKKGDAAEFLGEQYKNADVEFQVKINVSRKKKTKDGKVKDSTLKDNFKALAGIKDKALAGDYKKMRVSFGRSEGRKQQTAEFETDAEGWDSSNFCRAEPVDVSPQVKSAEFKIHQDLKTQITAMFAEYRGDGNDNEQVQAAS